MKHFFRFNVKGGLLFPLFIIFYVFLIISYSGLILGLFLFGKGMIAYWQYFMLLFFSLAVLFLIFSVFMILFSRKIVPSVEVSGTSLSFKGSVGRFMLMNLAGILLSIITAGVYLPWYLTRITRYYLGEIGYREQRLEFQGKGGRLFLILLFTLVFPMTAIVALLVTVFRIDPNAPHYRIIVQGITYLIMAPYLYGFYRWFFDLHVGDRTIRWDTRFGSSVARIMLQIILTLVTVGIYYPSAYLKLYSYFSSKTIIESERGFSGSFGFEGSVGRGFLLIWGQALLSIVTLGIYAPWGFCTIFKWIAENTYYRTD